MRPPLTDEQYEFYTNTVARLRECNLCAAVVYKESYEGHLRWHVKLLDLLQGMSPLFNETRQD